MKIKLWVDDIRPTPDGYTGFMTTNAALRFIYLNYMDIEEISLDHDCGWNMNEGGDYIKLGELYDSRERLEEELLLLYEEEEG